MAITSTGLGSGLDIESLVSSLVSSERSATDSRLTVRQSSANYSLSAVGTMKSAMSTLQTAMQRLMDDKDLFKRTVTSSKTDLLTVSSTSDAVPGNYSVKVLQLAQSHKVASDTFDSSTTELGAGSVQIAVGDSSFTVNLSSEANTLADLRTAINDASDNTGVSASLVTDDTGTRLVLTSNDTGTANQITVTSSLFGTTEAQEALDAQIQMEGSYTLTRSSNTISDAIDGLTFTLKDADVDTSINVAVTADKSSATSAIKNFVSAYNAMASTIASVTNYDADAQTAGALNGDAVTRALDQQLRRMVGGSVDSGGAFTLLSQIGVTMGSDNQLSVDDTKLSAALSDNFSAVRSLFAGDNGLASKMDDMLDNYLASDGPFEQKVKILNDRLDQISDQWDQLDDRMAKVEERYRKQFTAMDAIVSQYTSTANFLTQNFSNNSSS